MKSLALHSMRCHIFAGVLCIINSIAVHNVCANNRMFSSTNINDDSQNFIVKNNDVMLQTKSDITPIGMLTKAADGTFVIVNKSKTITNDSNVKHESSGNINNAQQVIEGYDFAANFGFYNYSIPPDGCYKLRNGFSFCVKNGVISSIGKDAYHDENDDSFFYESDLRCNVMKFELTMSLFVKKQSVFYDEYQLAIAHHPDLVKLIVLNNSNIAITSPQSSNTLNTKSSSLEEKKLSNSSNVNDKQVFFLSSKNDIGCIPYKKLTLYSRSEAQMYQLHVSKYRLLGPFINGHTNIDKVFMIIDGPNLLYYNTDMLKQM